MKEPGTFDEYILAICKAAFEGLTKCQEELNQYYLDEYRECSSVSKLREKRARSANPATVALKEMGDLIEKWKNVQ